MYRTRMHTQDTRAHTHTWTEGGLVQILMEYFMKKDKFGTHPTSSIAHIVRVTCLHIPKAIQILVDFL